ncbi:BLUF domain-containing protein [Maricaulis parjimensis]|uniref:BLUF domain-containing protein n=1 Tax=Maricaulis parjimensis TaxID=144023 RepID=UPI00193AA489|nr:BLUF domain-containing protein [Maricaulis parjimensis]
MVLTARSAIDLGAGSLSGPLGSLLTACMKASIEDCLTGEMAWQGDRFFLVLEGERRPLLRYLASARRDARLVDLRRLEFGPVDVREFETWCVGRRAGQACDGTDTLTAGEVRALIRDITHENRIATSPRLTLAA